MPSARHLKDLHSQYGIIEGNPVPPPHDHLRSRTRRAIETILSIPEPDRWVKNRAIMIIMRLFMIDCKHFQAALKRKFINVSYISLYMCLTVFPGQLYIDVLCRCCPFYDPLPRSRGHFNVSCKCLVSFVHASCHFIQSCVILSHLICCADSATRMSILERTRSTNGRVKCRSPNELEISNGKSEKTLTKLLAPLDDPEPETLMLSKAP